MTRRVVVSSVLPVEPNQWLGDDVTVVAPKGRMARDRLVSAASDADALIVLITEPVDEALLASAKRLKVIANYGVGVDNIDVHLATRKKIVVTNTPYVLTESTADLAFTLLLAAARRVLEGQRLVASGEWTGWEPTQLLGTDVAGRTLGLVGFGRIGQAVARRARGFDMRVLYCARHRVSPAVERSLGAEHATLEELLRKADFVSLHCPLTEQTRGLIDADALRCMKPSALLINTARGACVDEAALCQALDADEIAGAGLDVYEQEPHISDCLRKNQRVLLLPHLGSATRASRRRMVEVCARGIRSVFDGKRPDNIVNPEVWRD